MIKRALLVLLPFASPALAEGFSLVTPPIDCDLSGDACYIQQYMDRDPGAGAVDYTCAGLSYDGHKGTDFALPTLSDMAAGVAVVAAAPGTVAAVRDGMPDTGFTKDTAHTVAGRECGNGVLVRHTGGWETQYCHIRQGSVRVEAGMKVDAGTPLGLVGQSGRAQFPHVHLSVRKDGRQIDPFDPDGTLTCGAPGDSTLWQDPPAYQPGGLIDIGLADAIPDYSAVKAGTAARNVLSPDAPALVIFAYAFGTRKGDVFDLRIKGPEGPFIDQRVTVKRTQAQAYRAVGKRRRSAPWPAGQYEGTAALVRDGEVINSLRTTVIVSD
ncbi:MAG: M23 family metallopeptidase [Sulfitobacter sp.]|nr:M23 family metallopeptidase [Sulfitobacter sp.]